MKPLILIALKDEFQVSDLRYPVIYTGVGLVNAAIATHNGIQKYQPDVIINYGSAGALGNYTGLLNISRVCQRDADCRPLSPRGLMLGEDNLYLTNGDDGIKCGSGNNFVTNPDQWTKDHCDIVDMELFAIAKVCENFNIKWISKKFISDNADDNAGKVWKEKLIDGQIQFLNWLNSTRL